MLGMRKIADIDFHLQEQPKISFYLAYESPPGEEITARKSTSSQALKSLLQLQHKIQGSR